MTMTAVMRVVGTDAVLRSADKDWHLLGDAKQAPDVVLIRNAHAHQVLDGTIVSDEHEPLHGLGTLRTEPSNKGLGHLCPLSPATFPRTIPGKER